MIVKLHTVHSKVFLHGPELKQTRYLEYKHNISVETVNDCLKVDHHDVIYIETGHSIFPKIMQNVLFRNRF